MGEIILSKCIVTTQEDWVPVILKDEYISLARDKAAYQEKQSRERNLRNNAINKNPEAMLLNTTLSKYAEYAVKQWGGDLARVTNPGEFHDYPDVGQANVRFIGDPEDGLMISTEDQGEMPMILCTIKDKNDTSFKDKTIWLIGWGMTDQLRRIVYLINRTLENKNWGKISDMLPHEQCFFPRSMLYPMRTFSKEFLNLPYMPKMK